jgi:hypothetical protein
MKRLLLNMLITVCLLGVTAAHAGRACTEKQPDARTVMQAMELAHKTKLALEDSGAQVALIARVGQDLSKYGLRYSHMGYIWRDHPQGRWIVVHALNHCGTAESALYNEGLANFFMDDLFAYEALILVPNADLQRRVAMLLSSEAPLMLHEPSYNMVSYAFSTKYQNSNQWILELLAAASANDAKISERKQAQAWLKMVGFEPITVKVSALGRLGGRMFRANIAFDDHPFDRRMAGQIDTVTVDSINGFINQKGMILYKLVVTLD